MKKGANSPLKPEFFYPKKEQFNGLPNNHFENIFRLLKVTKSVEVSKDDVNALWEVFKEQNLTGFKEYQGESDMYRHFTNWSNKQSFRKKAIPKEKKEVVGIVGVEFINDFTQVKMTDGTIQDLITNQKDIAKFKQINPTSIKKKKKA